MKSADDQGMNPSSGRPRGLPTFEDMRCDAFRMLADALDVLRSDWRPDSQPSRRQYEALLDARKHIHAAQDALDAMVKRPGD